MQFVPCILGSHQTQKPLLVSLRSLPQVLIVSVSTRILTHETGLKVAELSDFEATKYGVDSINGLGPASETRWTRDSESPPSPKFLAGSKD